jgi:hypothetical protein
MISSVISASLIVLNSKLLFRMSSQLPEHVIKYAQSKGYSVGMESRGFMFNAEAVQLVDFFD